MPDPALEQAIREAYASAPADTVILHTLELRHPAFADDDGRPTAIRVVRDHVDLTARLEAGAPLDAGEAVRFVALAFELELPPVDPGAGARDLRDLGQCEPRDRPPPRRRRDQPRAHRGHLPALSLDRPRRPTDGSADYP